MQSREPPAATQNPPVMATSKSPSLSACADVRVGVRRSATTGHHRPSHSTRGQEVNVLKPHQKRHSDTLLENGVSQHEISRKTGIDRKTIRKLAQALVAPAAVDRSNSPMATGSAGRAAQIPPPRPPGLGARRRRIRWPSPRARPASRTGSGSRRRCGWAATPWRSTRSWSIALVSPAATTASSASAAACAETRAGAVRPAGVSARRRSPGRLRRGRARPGIPPAAAIAGPGCSS